MLQRMSQIATSSVYLVMAKSIIPLERLQDTILYIRGEKVMLDRDLAKIYGVETKRLNVQVKRNKSRFPAL